jgi:outer membrane protein
VKNLSLYLHGVWAIAFSVLLYLVLGNRPEAGKPVAAGSKTDARILYVNSDTLFKYYRYYLDLKSDAEARRGRIEADVQNRMRAFEQEVMAYQQEGGQMSAQMRQLTEANLMQKQQEIKKYSEEQSGRIAEEQARQSEKLIERITDYLKKRNKETGIQYVLSYSRGAGVLYANDSLDITKDILAGLNKEYAETQAAKKK